jgi:cobalt/nickel transport system ATP-binding protein
MEMSIDPIFEAVNLSYQYDQVIPALDNINFVVHPGENLAILGSNGSGKSTLLKILDGLYFPSGGSIKAFQQEVSEAVFQNAQFNTLFRSRVGFVFQDSDVQLFMPCVWDEVAFGPLQLGLSTDEVKDRVEKSLKALHIEALRDRPPFRLSSGEKKRVALASILSVAPDVWLLDEPSAGLDPRSTAWLKSFIQEQKAVGKTVVMATHDLQLVETCADRVYLLSEDHRVVAEGTADEVLHNTRQLIESNLLPDE